MKPEPLQLLFSISFARSDPYSPLGLPVIPSMKSNYSTSSCGWRTRQRAKTIKVSHERRIKLIRTDKRVPNRKAIESIKNLCVNSLTTLSLVYRLGNGARVLVFGKLGVFYWFVGRMKIKRFHYNTATVLIKDQNVFHKPDFFICNIVSEGGVVRVGHREGLRLSRIISSHSQSNRRIISQSEDESLRRDKLSEKNHLPPRTIVTV
ncbi:hypothetical protein BDA99DRAFT_533335 [Phascolomyces articulosus]|uniref:Uncharacterized protein n=1 Tax=Phascolomyces articulosus TaxID=60185 RepID=A0AAD5PK40_9FUNG|nr:hypothetical protein BDA99DRAFT_533335 [Phascolomyces articulosus]